MEVIHEIWFQKRHTPVGPDELSLPLFKGGGRMLTTTKLLGSIWASKQITNDWCESVILKIYKNDDGSSCENRIKISLISIPLKLLGDNQLCRLCSTSEEWMQENQTSFRGIRGRVDQIFNFWQETKHRHTFVGPRSPSTSIWKRRSAKSIVQFFDAAHHRRMWRTI